MPVALALLSSCSPRSAAPPPEPRIEQQARQFVTLALTLGRHFPPEIDSYFGPAALQPPVSSPLPAIDSLRPEIARLGRDLADPQPDLRHRRLQERTRRLAALIDVIQSKEPLPFDKEAERLYGLDAPPPDAGRFKTAREKLDRLLPGSGSLTHRVQAFRERFVVPERLRPALFSRALAECRTRTLRHWKLPPTERLDIEWTSDVGAAWHRYQGGFRSVLQVNPQAVAFLGSIIDVACHEGYPGHHVQFLLAEARAGAGKLPVEDTVVLLRSPGSVLREGVAEYSVSLVFPTADRLVFERDVLFAMAGFSPTEAERFEQIRYLLDQLAPASLPVLRAYRDHAISAAAAAAALDREALIASPQALLAFVDSLGAYVTGYTGVRDQVRSIVEGENNPADARRWARLNCIIQLADQRPLGQIADTIRQQTDTTFSCTPTANGVRQ